MSELEMTVKENIENKQNPNFKWYIVHAHSGMEKAAERNILERVQRSSMQELFGRILVPTEEMIEIKSGQKKISERKLFPSYVFIEMLMNDDTWHLVKHSSKVIGFIGGAKNKPTPVPQVDIEKIIKQIQEGSDKPKHKIEFIVGEVVRIKDGPFADFNGTVEEVNYEKNRLHVAVAIFGRSTPVELDFHQVEKL